MSSRKKVSEPTSHLRVAVRVRPMNGTEKAEKSTNIVKVDKSSASMISLKGKSFGPFFRVYDSKTTQADVYDDLVSSQIKKVIAGFNCTVFAYGQTGTGKTFTMEGGRTDVKSSHDDPTTGIIPRAVEDIFEQLEASGCEEYSLRVSYVELYNEELFDLLASGSDDRERLRIFDDPNKKGVIVSGVEEVPVRNRADVFKLLGIGAEKRRTAATLMNMHSSRSHSLFMVNVVVRENTHTGEELVKQGKLNLVDLAGSENIGRSGAQGNRAKEAGSINQSLLTLGRVIRSLTTNAQHIPYRESKLTRLLQDSLGGSTITSLIATMSPSSSNFDESQSTLEYAMRAANIKNKPVCNSKVSKKTILKEYSDEIEKLRRDLRAAREKNGVIISEESHEEFQRNTAKVEDLEQRLESAVDRLRWFAEDQMHMDEQYQKLYQRKEDLEDRLRERLREMAEKEKELADTKDELSKYMDALATMYSNSLKSFDQLTKTRDAAEKMETDLGAFWRKVDEMKKADDKNKSTVEKFIEQMVSQNARMREHVASVQESTALIATEIVESLKLPCQEVETAAGDIAAKAEELEITTTNCFQEAAEVEKKLSDSVRGWTENFSEKLENNLKLCREFYQNHSERSNKLTEEILGRLEEIKVQTAQFTGDVIPLLSEIRGTVCESVENQFEHSDATTTDVKQTCSAMAEEMKALLLQIEQMSVRVEEAHNKQTLARQSAQENVLSSLSTVENVIQSLEDTVEEQCNVEEVNRRGKEDLAKIEENFGKEVTAAEENSEENNSHLKTLTSDLLETAEANRSENAALISVLVQKVSDNSKKSKKATKEVAKKSKQTAFKLRSEVDAIDEASRKSLQETSDVIGRVVLHHVNPLDNVPERVISSFPLQTQLISPLDPETLLCNSEDAYQDENEDSKNEMLAKKKRRVTTFVRRDSLLDTTNVFMSPTTILKKREQTIEEEEFEN